MGQEYSEELFEILSKFGIHISFNEGILFLAPILHGKNKEKIICELIRQILLNVIEAVFSIIKRGEKYKQFSKTVVINLDKFSPRTKARSNFKHYKQLEYTSLEDFNSKLQYDTSNYENEQFTNADIWYELKHASDRTYLSTLGDKTELILQVSLTKMVGEITVGNTSNMINWRKNNEMKEYYTNQLESTVKKFKNCQTATKKILFFNNDSTRVSVGQTDTLKDSIETIKEIANKKEYELIDEIWVEYYLGKDVGHDLNFAMIIYDDEKHYERIK